MVIDDPGETAAFNIVLLIDSGKQRFFFVNFALRGPLGGAYLGPDQGVCLRVHRVVGGLILCFWSFMFFCCCSFGRCLCRCRWPYFRAISIHGKWWAISSAKPGRKIQKHTYTNTIASPVWKYKTKIEI